MRDNFSAEKTAQRHLDMSTGVFGHVTQSGRGEPCVRQDMTADPSASLMRGDTSQLVLLLHLLLFHVFLLLLLLLLQSSPACCPLSVGLETLDLRTLAALLSMTRRLQRKQEEQRSHWDAHGEDFDTNVILDFSK